MIVREGLLFFVFDCDLHTNVGGDTILRNSGGKRERKRSEIIGKICWNSLEIVPGLAMGDVVTPATPTPASKRVREKGKRTDHTRMKKDKKTKSIFGPERCRPTCLRLLQKNKRLQRA